MARFDYGKMQATADRLLDRFQQGVVTLIRPGTMGTPPNEWTAGTMGDDTVIALAATVRRVEQKYVDGTVIVGTEDQITFAVPSIVPVMTDTFTVDGKARTLVDLRPLPAAGTIVAYVAFVAN